MANYATAAHMRLRWEGATGDTIITDLTKTSNTTLQNELLEFFLENACGVIDAYLNKFYDVPVLIDASNGFLRQVALCIADYSLWKRTLGDDVPTKVKEDYTLAMEVLDDIKEGALPPIAVEPKYSSIDISSDTPQMRETDLWSHF